MWPLIKVVAGVVAGLKVLDYLSTPSAFISFAAEDANVRDLLVGQSKHPDAKWKIDDRSLHEPFTNAWKTQTREIIRESDIVIVLIGPTTHAATGVDWEVRCATEENVPILGVIISKDNPGKVPNCLRGHRVIEWTQDGLAKELERATGN